MTAQPMPPESSGSWPQPSGDWPAEYPTQPIPAVAATPPRADSKLLQLIVPVALGVGVSVGLGVYGKLHDPTGVAVNVAGFSSPLTVKVWLASCAFVLALFQLFSALVMYGKLPVKAPSWIGTAHRWSGRLAFLLTIPVAMHCLYALGFGSYNARVLVHSLFGCMFFGAFATKMLVLSRKGMPGWALPLFGGLVFTGLVVLWLSSSLWFFTTSGIKF
jgi:hypothetical protein